MPSDQELQHKLSSQDHYYEEIGRLIVEQAQEKFIKAWAYAEVTDGVYSVDLFYKNENQTWYQKSNPELRKLVYNLWEEYKKNNLPQWYTMVYMLNDGNFEVDFGHHDVIMDDNSDAEERRNQLIQKYMEGADIQYPKRSE
jgi:hypothetical protein